jgi:hypothetical protein
MICKFLLVSTLLDKVSKIFPFLRILISRESGIYSHWKQEILRIHGNKRNIDEVIESDTFKYENLSLIFLLDVLYLWITGILISILILILEKLMFTFPLSLLFEFKFTKFLQFIVCNKSEKLSERRISVQRLKYYKFFNRNGLPLSETRLLYINYPYVISVL